MLWRFIIKHNVLWYNLAKGWNPKICVYNCLIDLQLDRCFDSTTAETPATLQHEQVNNLILGFESLRGIVI